MKANFEKWKNTENKACETVEGFNISAIRLSEIEEENEAELYW